MPSPLLPHYQHQLKDDKPKDLTEEIANLRALMRAHYSKLQRTLDDKGQPVQVTLDDLTAIMQITESIGRMVERQAKVSPDRVVTVQDMLTIITQIIDVIHENIPNDIMDVRGRVVDGINKCATQLLMASTEQSMNGNQ